MPQHGAITEVSEEHLRQLFDQRGVVLDILVQDRGNATAARRFFKRLIDGLRSYGVAARDVMPEVQHRQSRYLNNRAENSHRPTRRRERQMQRFKSSGQTQRFLSAYGIIHGRFHTRRRLMTAPCYRSSRSEAFGTWRQETCARLTTSARN